TSTASLFPYTTLFRSNGHEDIEVVRGRGQEENGHLGGTANLLAPVKAVIKGQHQVENDQVGLQLLHLAGHIPEVFRHMAGIAPRSEEHTSELQSRFDL